MSMIKSLGTIHFTRSYEYKGVTALELTGTYRINLLSNVLAVLADLNCSVVDANVWTHNGRIASHLYVKDSGFGCLTNDLYRISRIESRVMSVLNEDNDNIGTANNTSTVSMEITYSERRLHQMMFDDRDYERTITPSITSFKYEPVYK